MTTEVAVMNSQAVALAADSAGTVNITGPEGKRQKIFLSENKLFALSKYNPVGIMEYGKLDFMGLPFEILLKEYRKRLGRKTFNTLHQYATDFINFVDKHQEFYPEAVQSKHYASAARKLLQQMKKEAKGEDNAALVHARDKLLRDLRGIADLPKLPRGLVTRLSKRYEAEVKKVLNETLAKRPSASETRKWIRLFALMATKPVDFPVDGDFTGVVIAGYGTKDLFPCVETYRFYGRFADFFKYYREDKEEKKGDASGRRERVSIMVYAQRDVVSTLMDGIDPDYRDILLDNLKDLLGSLAQSTIDGVRSLSPNVRKQLRTKLDEGATKMLKELDDKMTDYQNRTHSLPIIMNTAFLSKLDLAEFAESLVATTSFLRRSSIGEASVGGPVDVAVISKADGFVWIKRKHYFKPELNPQFFQTYFNEPIRRKP